MAEFRFKYQKELDELLARGCQLPPLFAPNDLSAYRFAFSSLAQQNHIPQYVRNPKRMLKDMAKGEADTSLLSLSCFETEPQAESFYSNLRKAFKNAWSSIGDSLAQGVLTNDDGVKTKTSGNGHFDFYEYEQCDLNRSFIITKPL